MFKLNSCEFQKVKMINFWFFNSYFGLLESLGTRKLQYFIEYQVKTFFNIVICTHVSILNNFPTYHVRLLTGYGCMQPRKGAIHYIIKNTYKVQQFNSNYIHN